MGIDRFWGKVWATGQWRRWVRLGRILWCRRGVRLWHEAGLKQMTVVVEFDSYEIALAAYESEDYKKALAVLGPEVERDFRIVEGA